MCHHCLNAKKALAEIYDIEPMYNTHNHLSSQIQSTPDLHFRYKIKKMLLYIEKMNLKSK